MNMKGFTLTELAIVLIIIGVITAGGFKVIYSAIDNGKFTSSGNQIESIIKEIAEYSARARRIPSASELADIVSPLSDSFGNTVYYLPAATLETTESICAASGTGISVRKCNDAACSEPVTYGNIAFFLSSDSVNGIRQLGGTAPQIDIYNENITVNGNVYDDITGWLTLNSLRQYAGCEGPAMAIIENEFPQAYMESGYAYTLHAKGGDGNYSWCAESSDAEVRENIYYGGMQVKTPGSCSGNTDAAVSNLTIDSNSAVLDSSSDLFSSGSKIRIYLADSAGAEVYKDFVFRVKQSYEIVLAANGESAEKELETAGTKYYDAPGADEVTNTDSNQNMVQIDNSEDGAIEFSDSGFKAGSACVWFYNDDGVDFLNRSMAVYFEYEPKTLSTSGINNTLHGFTYAVIPSHNSDGSSTRYSCGDKGSSLGFAGKNIYVDKPISGEGFALELDNNYEAGRNDPSGQHISIVSYIAGADPDDDPVAYNIHSSSYNDDCSSVKGSGCYKDDSLFTENRKVGIRLEAYHGCAPNGTNCGNSAEGNNNICVYGWYEIGADGIPDEMRDVSERYMTDPAETAPSALGQPAVLDCYPAAPGRMESIRPGFTLSAGWAEYQLAITNLSTDIR